MNATDIVIDIIKREGRSQKWLADRMGVSKQMVSKTLHSQDDMRVSTFVFMLTILGYTFKVIKAGEDDE